jgi:hypothetical protein
MGGDVAGINSFVNGYFLMSSLQGLGKDYIFWKTSNYLLNTKDKTTY